MTILKWIVPTARIINFVRHNHVAAKLREIYRCAKIEAEKPAPVKRVNPRAVFTNYEMDLRKIGVYGFDYDYTLAVYTKNLNTLVYDLTMHRMVKDMKYPEELLDLPCDLEFSIRGLHYDIEHSCLLKVDAFNQIQKGTVFRGRRKLSETEVREMYGDFSIPDNKGRHLPQLIDLFSLPWAGLLSMIVEYFDQNQIPFNPTSLYNDVAECVKQVHVTGEMYGHVANNCEHYIHKNEGLKEYLEMLYCDDKELFMITNSPYSFMNVGMTFMLGPDWRKLFKYVVVSARKPDFFRGNSPFRLYNEQTDGLSYEKVDSFIPDRVYSGGNMKDFDRQAKFKHTGVLYFGDHIYTDLSDPMLTLGWHTAAIVPELAREIRAQNTETFRYIITWTETLTQLIETYQRFGDKDAECQQIMLDWAAERRRLREHAKSMFNNQFGSMFRTFHSMTYFYRQMSRLTDIYTSRLPNMRAYGTRHTFFPRRNALPHESALNVIDQEFEIFEKDSQLKHEEIQM